MQVCIGAGGFMATKRTEREPVRNTSDPTKPAYDNPVGNKGEVVAEANARKPPPRAKRRDAPIGHDSDKKLGGPRQ
jgi:hypothetical protein